MSGLWESLSNQWNNPPRDWLSGNWKRVGYGWRRQDTGGVPLYLSSGDLSLCFLVIMWAASICHTLSPWCLASPPSLRNGAICLGTEISEIVSPQNKLFLLWNCSCQVFKSQQRKNWLKQKWTGRSFQQCFISCPRWCLHWQTLFNYLLNYI